MKEVVGQIVSRIEGGIKVDRWGSRGSGNSPAVMERTECSGKDNKLK
jgi:hypothetical protein